MPAWAAHDASVFWDAAGRYERANARLCTEIETSLPRKLDEVQRVELVRKFVKNVLGERHAYS